jgi:hypothetical protein
MFGLPIRPLIAVGAMAAAWYYTGGHLLDGVRSVLEEGQCRMRVEADVLNVRSGPGTTWRIVDTFRRGAVTSAEPIVWHGFRRLGEGRWSATRYLVPMDGEHC